eukprot:1830156-Pyramimonas_sp.AAC.1
MGKRKERLLGHSSGQKPAKGRGVLFGVRSAPAPTLVTPPQGMMSVIPQTPTLTRCKSDAVAERNTVHS